MKQTAVEWLAIQLHTHWGNEDVSFEKLFEQAKAMEKEQMKMFYQEADSYSCTCYLSPTDIDFEQYYNENFKK